MHALNRLLFANDQRTPLTWARTACITAPAQPESTYNFTLDDTSPFILYSPYSDGTFDGGWQQWYSGNGFLTQPGEDGIGDSFHVTSFPGAALTITFFGVGIELRGTINRTIEVSVDGSIQSTGSPPAGVLFSTNGLDAGSHSVQLSLPQDSSKGVVQFDSAILFSLPPDKAQGEPSSERIDNQNFSIITYSSNDWGVENAHQVPSLQHPAPFQRTNHVNASASMNFTGRAIAINGMIDWGYWTYKVELDGQPYLGLNASTYWIAPDAVLFYQDGLDENVTHSINITNTGSGMLLAINSFTVYGFKSFAAGGDANASTPSVTAVPPNSSNSPTNSTATRKPLSRGVVAGLVIGITCALVLLLGVFMLLRRHRHRRKYDALNAQPRPNEMLQTHLFAPHAYGNEKPRILSTDVEPSTTPIAGPSLLDRRIRDLKGTEISTPPSNPTTLALPPPASEPNTHSAQPPVPSSFVSPRDGLSELSTAAQRGSSEPDSVAADRIADIVFERLVSRLPQNDGRMTPPPEYDSGANASTTATSTTMC